MGLVEAGAPAPAPAVGPQPFLNFGEHGVFMNTKILDVPTEIMMGVLAAFPNTVMELPTVKVTMICKMVFTYLTRKVLEQPQSVLPWQRFLLAPVVLLTRTDASVSFKDQLIKRANSILRDEWDDFTVKFIMGNSTACSDRALSPEAAANQQQQILERTIEKMMGKGAMAKTMKMVTEQRERVEGSAHTLQALRSKNSTREELHFEAPWDPAVQPQEGPRHVITLDDIFNDLRHAPKMTKHGLDKVRYEHVRAMMGGSMMTEELAGDYGKNLTEIINKIAYTEYPASLGPYFRDCEIVAVPKGEGDVRPVCITGVYRKLSMKSMKEVLNTTEFKNLQFGMDVSGCEKIINTFRYIFETRKDHDIFVMDGKNAFNNSNRRKCLEQIYNKSPQLFPFAHSLYGTDANLWYKGIRNEVHAIQSQTGQHQGCTGGTGMYGVTMMPLILEIKAALEQGDEAAKGLVMFFVDDGNLAAPFEAMMRALKVVREQGPSYGYLIKYTAGRYLLAKCDDNAEAHDAGTYYWTWASRRTTSSCIRTTPTELPLHPTMEFRCWAVSSAPTSTSPVSCSSSC
jgi:hypothetical protein